MNGKGNFIQNFLTKKTLKIDQKKKEKDYKLWDRVAMVPTDVFACQELLNKKKNGAKIII